MQTSAIQGARNGVPPAVANNGPKLGREDFLKLLITQLQMQDPFQPMDNEDMIAQLATFSSLEQLEQINVGLQNSLDMDLLLGQLLNNTMATNLIGRNVHVASDSFKMDSNDDVTIGYRLAGQAQSVTVKIYDDKDRLVRTLKPEELKRGAHSVEWDGRDEDGKNLGPGDYRYEVEALGPGDSQIGVDSYLVGLVEGIRYRDGQAWLVVGDDLFGLGSVLEVVAADGSTDVADAGSDDAADPGTDADSGGEDDTPPPDHPEDPIPGFIPLGNGSRGGQFRP